MSNIRIDRRDFVQGVGAVATWSCLGGASDGQRTAIPSPRATDGDARSAPNWESQLTLTVGEQTGDLVGNGDRVLQAAVGYVSRLGGGTVRILPGTYKLRNSVFLPSNVRVIGSGEESIITRDASESVELADDSDWYDQEITLRDATGFHVGDGIVLQASNPDHGGQTVIKRTLVAQSGNRFKLNRGLRENLWLSGKPTCASLFPLFASERTSNVHVENLTFDGNRDNVANLNGNHGGCIFIQDCNRFEFRKLTTRNYNGDGISFQVCHDVVIEDCHSHHNANLGLHPGSGSQRPLIRNNLLEHNDLGLFWCWGVRFGLAEGNRIDSNQSYGISIGHRDTDNVMRNNDTSNSGKVGILFRNDARGQDFWANRNAIEQNRIVDSGGENGIGISIEGKTKDVRIIGNDLRETRQPAKRVGIAIGQDVGSLSLKDNRIEGFANSVADRRV